MTYPNFAKLWSLYDAAPNASGDSRLKTPPKLRKTIIERDKVCQVCLNAPIKRVHHIIPHGKSTEENLVGMCINCHEYLHYLLKRKGYKFVLPFRYFRK